MEESKKDGATMMYRQGQLLAGWIVMLALAVVCGGCERKAPADEAEAAAYAKAWNGPVRIVGTIKDQDGAPISDVECDVEESRMKSAGPKSTTRTMKLRSEFSLEFNNVASVELSFYKEGYFERHRSFTFALPEGPYTIKDGALEFSSPIKLVAVPTETRQMYMYRCEVELNQNGLPDTPEGMTARVLRTRYLHLGRKGNEVVTAQEMAEVFARRCALVPSNDMDLGEPYIAAVLLPDPSVQPLIVNTGFDDVAVSPAGARAQLVLRGDPEGGFIVYTDPEEGRNFSSQTIPLEMVQAPASGYSPVLEIAPEWIRDNPERRTFFFCRLGGHYGKGSLVPYYFKHTLRIELTIYMAEGEGRNVATQELLF
jgi:hypothetical protein